MSTQLQKTEKPKLASLCQDLGLAQKVDNFNTLLNQDPPKAWLREHKGVQYQPIERVKNNLLIIFQDYDWSIKDIKIMANSILVYGTLTIVNPITGKESHKDGVGAWPIQLKAKSNPMQIENIVQDAIQKNAPAAESLALKNAAAKFGKFFGDGKQGPEFKPVYSAAVENIEKSATDKIKERSKLNGVLH